MGKLDIKNDEKVISICSSDLSGTQRFPHTCRQFGAHYSTSLALAMQHISLFVTLMLSISTLNFSQTNMLSIYFTEHLSFSSDRVRLQRTVYLTLKALFSSVRSWSCYLLPTIHLLPYFIHKNVEQLWKRSIRFMLTPKQLLTLTALVCSIKYFKATTPLPQ